MTTIPMRRVALLSLLAMILATLPNFKGICIALMWRNGLTGDERQSGPGTFDY